MFHLKVWFELLSCTTFLILAMIMSFFSKDGNCVLLVKPTTLRSVVISCSCCMMLWIKWRLSKLDVYYISNICETLILIFNLSSGNLGSDVVDNIQKQENTIQQCINQLEKIEAIRVALVSQLREALEDQVWSSFFQIFSLQSRLLQLAQLSFSMSG